MKIIAQQTEQKVVSKVVEILCNKCGQSALKDMDYQNGSFYGTHIRYQGGYCSGPEDSKAPGIRDMDVVDFHICENCIFEYMKSFKIPAIHYCSLANPRYEEEEKSSENEEARNLLTTSSLEQLAPYFCSEHEVIRNLAGIRREEMLRGEVKNINLNPTLDITDEDGDTTERDT